MFKLRGTYTPIMLPEEFQRRSPAGQAIGLAGELSRECSEHGAPWVSFGDVAVDSGGNASVVDRSTTCYVRSDQPLPRDMLSCYCPDDCGCRSEHRRTYCGCDHYSATIPAYKRPGIARASPAYAADNYGRTLVRVYESRAEYLEGLD